MWEKWITANAGDWPMVLFSGLVAYVAILAYVRVAGLRSFSKMTAADFAMTVAVGSVFGATIASPSPTLVFGLLAMAVLFAGQWFFALVRRRVPAVSKITDNSPLLLMAGGEIVYANLRRANLTESDLFGKLREANALNYEAVLAVVFESTGDVSVLHASDEETLHPDFLRGVIGAERMTTASVDAAADQPG